MPGWRRYVMSGVLAAAVLGILAAPAAAEREQRKLVEDAAAMVKAMLNDPEWRDFQDIFEDAKAVVLVPDFLKAGFIVGGAGGRCIIAARLEEGWSHPLFCVMGGASLGLQIGAEKSEVILMIMTDKALRSLLTTRVKLGGEAGLAVGTVGAGVGGATTTNLDADIVAFARSVGLFGGIAIEGSYIEAAEKWNRIYYGRSVEAEDVLIQGAVRQPHADVLRNALARGRQAQSSHPATRTSSAAPAIAADAAR